jgi:hypothetical protein
MSWKSKQVRNLDGREGVIVNSDKGVFAEITLTILATDGSKAKIVLENYEGGPDSGETGWQWLCEDFAGGPTWIVLGDHNDRSLFIDNGINAALPQDQA